MRNRHPLALACLALLPLLIGAAPASAAASVPAIPLYRPPATHLAPG